MLQIRKVLSSIHRPLRLPVGTRCRRRAFQGEKKRGQVRHFRLLITQLFQLALQFLEPFCLVRQFLGGGREKDRRGAVGVAGPVVEGRSQVVNLKWPVDRRRLAYRIAAACPKSSRP